MCHSLMVMLGSSFGVAIVALAKSSATVKTGYRSVIPTCARCLTVASIANLDSMELWWRL